MKSKDCLMNYENIEGTSFGCWEFLDKDKRISTGGRKRKAILILCTNCENQSIVSAYNIRRRHNAPTFCKMCKPKPKNKPSSGKSIMGFKLEVVEEWNKRRKNERDD